MVLASRTMILVAVLLTSCGFRRPIWIPAVNESAQKMEDERAYKQDKEADLEILEDLPDRMFVYSRDEPKSHVQSSIPEANLFEVASKSTKRRALVVVHLWGPIDQYDYVYEDRVNHIESVLKAVGFKHVIFHLNKCCSHPIFRE